MPHWYILIDCECHLSDINPIEYVNQSSRKKKGILRLIVVSFEFIMFKNLKEKLATQVNKTNQTLFSSIISSDSVCLQGFLIIISFDFISY
jgi:hypothetical protein